MPFEKSRPASIHTRGLPHWQQEGVTYFVTFRLGDSLPQEVYGNWREERNAALSEAKKAVKLSEQEKEELIDKIEEEYREKLERHLDKGIGDCSLRDPALARIVENALRHFDGERYLLGSYVIMPNHIHVLVRPAMEHKLPDILQSWKSFTAKELNKVLGQAGEFWQAESFDHIVRNGKQLEKFTYYIHENPLKAHLPDGQFRLGIGLGGKTEENRTGETPVPLPKAIRFGLAAIKGVGEVAVQTILKARDESGKFETLADMCQRVDGRTVSRKILEGLIKSGACDCFGQTRATLFAQIDRTLTRAAGIISDRQRGQSSLFGALEEKNTPMPEAATNLPEWPQHELLAHEKELLGFYVTGHPLTPYASILEKYALATTSTLPQLPNRSLTRIGGLIAAVQNGVSKKSGKPYAMVTLEDLEGSVQILCMNENYDKYHALLAPNKAILVIGEVNTGEDRPKIFPQEIMPLEDAPRKFTKQVYLRLQLAHLQAEHMESVRDLVLAHPGRCPLFLCFGKPTGEKIYVETHEKFSVTPSRELQQAVDELFGEETYFAKVDTSLPERVQRRWEKKPEMAAA